MSSTAVPESRTAGQGTVVSRPSRSLLTRLGTFPVVLCSFVILKMFFFSRSGVGDNDIFWHLRNGQFMFLQHHFPSFDTYSYTVPGAHWISHEWLAELFYYGAYRLFHLQGLLLLTAFVPAITASVMFYLGMRRAGDPFAAGLATMLGTCLMSVGDGPRMHHFGYLCFVIMLAILQEFRLHRTGPLWVIPLLFCAWINLHGSWSYGIAIFGVIFLAGLVPHDLGRLIASPWSKQDIVKLVGTGLASVAALFVNPFGYKLVWYPFDMVFHQKLNLQVVQEWRHFTFVGGTGLWVGVVIAAVVLFTAMTNVRWRIDDIALTLFVLYCGLSHERMLLPAGIVLATLLAPFLTGLSSYDPAHERKALNLVLVSCVLLTIIVMFPREKKLQKEIDDAYPLNAVNYLRAHGGGKRLLNEYDWGGYLEWTMPEQRVFIDSRTDIFEYAGVLRQMVDFLHLNKPGDVLEQQHIDTVLTRPDTHVTVWMDLQPNWKQVYHDSVAVVYVRAQK